MARAEAVNALLSGLTGRLDATVGGKARLRVVLLLGGVLSLQSADTGTVGALAPQLERAFHIGNTEVGLLITASSLMAAASSLPMGVLVDSTHRVRLLVVTVSLWSVCMAASGLATGYGVLLLTRLALGAVIAASGPAVASLTGDLFPAKERSRIYGMVLTGELLGAGAGLILSADIGAAAGWRAPFFVLAVPSIVLAISLHRLLPEPGRGGQSWLRPGDERIKPAEEVAGPPTATDDGDAGTGPSPAVAMSVVEDSEVRRRARERPDIEPHDDLLREGDPADLSTWGAVRYVLRIRSNLVLIGASVLGYFFLAGVRSFALLFSEGHFQISQGAASLLFVLIGVGAVAGTLAGGRVADWLVHRGTPDARPIVAGVSFIGAALVFLPGLLSGRLLVSWPLFMVAGGLLSSPNPALNAARLDVVPSALWGRAEAVRTFGQALLEAFAPLIFGYVSSLLGGPQAGFGSGLNPGSERAMAATGTGLEYTFIIMLAPLFAAGVLLLMSRRAYLRDVATADATERAHIRPR
jgi:predicted MFS family arabinose efflux permease